MSEKPQDASMIWNLSELFTSFDDPAMEATLKQVAEDAESFAATYRGTINVSSGPEAQHLRSGLERMEAVYSAMNKVAAYAFLLFSSDTSKPEHQNLQQQVEQAYIAIHNKLLFFGLEWIEVPDEVAQSLIDDAILANYRHYLQSERRYKPHILSEAEEQLVNEKNITGQQAWQQFFTELTSSLKFPLERDGETKEVTMDEVLVTMRHPDRSIREQAHTTLYQVLNTQMQTLAYIYNTLLQDHLTMNRLRRYSDPMDPRNLANEITAETVNTMMDVVEQNHLIAQDYFALKAQLLDLPVLQIYDQYAPIGKNKATIPYSEAKEIILDAFGQFDTSFRDIANDFFAGNWIDAEVRTGKRGGAFCSAHSPNHHPYILCNYKDDMRDVMTVAHELGHGIHFTLSRKQTMFNYFSTLPLAETASVFAEMLVFEHLLNRQQSEEEKLALICGKIEDIMATIFRQNVLTRFEQSAFHGRAEHGRLTPEQLSAYWTEANGRYYGEVLEMTPGYENGWSYIPHFINSPFYCYSYVFGELLVLALYGKYREEGESFVPRYRALLESGGSQTPDELLAAIGVDTRDPEFWQLGFRELRRFVDWAKELAATSA